MWENLYFFSEVWRITNSLHKRLLLLLNVNILFISVIFGENILRLSSLDQIINSKELNNAFKQCRKRRIVDQHFQSIPGHIKNSSELVLFMLHELLARKINNRSSEDIQSQQRNYGIWVLLLWLFWHKNAAVVN